MARPSLKPQSSRRKAAKNAKEIRGFLTHPVESVSSSYILLELQPRTSASGLGPPHSYWRSRRYSRADHCRRRGRRSFPASVYRAVARSPAVLRLERAAGQGYCHCWSLGNTSFQFLVLCSQLFAFCSPCACLPCYNALPYRSKELLGPQKRISIVVLRPDVRPSDRPGVPGSAGWKTPRS